MRVLIFLCFCCCGCIEHQSDGNFPDLSVDPWIAPSPEISPSPAPQFRNETDPNLEPDFEPAPGSREEQDPDRGQDPVPEPGTLLLVGIGITVIAWNNKRKDNKNGNQ